MSTLAVYLIFLTKNSKIKENFHHSPPHLSDLQDRPHPWALVHPKTKRANDHTENLSWYNRCYVNMSIGCCITIKRETQLYYKSIEKTLGKTYPFIYDMLSVKSYIEYGRVVIHGKDRNTDVHSPALQCDLYFPSVPSLPVLPHLPMDPPNLWTPVGRYHPENNFFLGD